MHTMTYHKTIMQMSCHERRGTVLRTVKHEELGVSDVLRIFEKLGDLPSMFSNEPMKNTSKIWRAIDNGWDFLTVDDVGIIGIGRTYRHGRIDVHMTFWDKVLVGREELCREVAEWARDFREAEGVYTAIPTSARATIAFAKRVGFVGSGYVENIVSDRNGQPDDVLIMDLY